MLEWLAENGTTISALSNVGMLLVWGVYLGTFLRQFRRQTQAKIVINRAAGSGLDSACFVSNMSSEPIYVEAIRVALESRSGTWFAFVTDMMPHKDEEVPDDPRQRTRQGPMRSGDYMPIGSFAELLDRIDRVNEELDGVNLEDHEQPAIRITVFADYAAEDIVIGAERIFHFCLTEGTWRPRTFGRFTDQIRSRRRRLFAQKQIED